MDLPSAHRNFNCGEKEPISQQIRSNVPRCPRSWARLRPGARASTTPDNGDCCKTPLPAAPPPRSGFHRQSAARIRCICRHESAPAQHGHARECAGIRLHKVLTHKLAQSAGGFECASSGNKSSSLHSPAARESRKMRVRFRQEMDCARCHDCGD